MWSIKKPAISVIVVFYNMTREAARTLYSLSTLYQQEIGEELYEVIAVDSGSREALDPAWVSSFGKNFRYIYYESPTPSPSGAINHAVQKARGSAVMCCIDGARILSPGILRLSLQALKLHDHPFIYTIGMHIGSKVQNELIEEGYNQEDEDKLLDGLDWWSNGYLLFTASSLASSSRNGFFSEIAESNCFTMRKDDFQKLGGYDENFASPGGGLVNLDFFNRVHQDKMFFPVLLLGEATFHQFHGGVATNVSRKTHPWPAMAAEYKEIRGQDYECLFRPPHYFGRIDHTYHKNLLQPPGS